MSYNIDFSLATSNQIELALYERIEQIRLSRNITQAQLAETAGISARTIRRMVKGERVSLNTFIRILTALDLVDNLRILLPDPSIEPLERIKNNKTTIRKRARPTKTDRKTETWKWEKD